MGTTARRTCRVSLVLALAGGPGACITAGTDITDVSVALNGEAALAVGDTVTVRARATTGLLPPTEVAASATAPGLFRWRSSAPAVLAVSAAGLVRGVAPGEATVTAEYRGHADSVRFVIHRPAVALAVRFARASVAVGDTVGATVDALDAAGQSVPGVVVAVFPVLFRTREVFPPDLRPLRRLTPLPIVVRADSVGPADLVVQSRYAHPGRELEARNRRRPAGVRRVGQPACRLT